MKKKYEIIVGSDRIYVSRDFPELKRVIRRIFWDCLQRESLIARAKREILREAQEVWGFPKKKKGG